MRRQIAKWNTVLFSKDADCARVCESPDPSGPAHLQNAIQLHFQGGGIFPVKILYFRYISLFSVHSRPFCSKPLPDRIIQVVWRTNGSRSKPLSFFRRQTFVSWSSLFGWPSWPKRVNKSTGATIMIYLARNFKDNIICRELSYRPTWCQLLLQNSREIAQSVIIH